MAKQQGEYRHNVKVGAARKLFALGARWRFMKGVGSLQLRQCEERVLPAEGAQSAFPGTPVPIEGLYDQKK